MRGISPLALVNGNEQLPTSRHQGNAKVSPPFSRRSNWWSTFMKAWRCSRDKLDFGVPRIDGACLGSPSTAVTSPSKMACRKSLGGRWHPHRKIWPKSPQRLDKAPRKSVFFNFVHVIFSSCWFGLAHVPDIAWQSFWGSVSDHVWSSYHLFLFQTDKLV
jgi:hypothetical protein